MGRPPAKSLDRGVLPMLLGYVLRRTQSAVFADFASTFQAAGAALGIDRSTLVPILDRLQARGLLVRRRSPTDGRTHALMLTPSGNKALGRFTTLVRRHEKRIGSGLSTAETRTLIGLLEKVRAGARSL